MNFKKILCIALALLFLQSCGDSQIGIELNPTSNSQDDIIPTDGLDINTGKLSKFEKSFVPELSPAIYDINYMQRVNEYLDQLSEQYSTLKLFKDIVKTIAWKESRWTHYYKKNNNVLLLKGDNGASFGMFQIYTKYHPELPLFKDNSEYALNMIWRIFERAQVDNCEDGSNQGSDESSLLRRVYATYNGGSRNTCRNDHHRDDTFVDTFHDKPWNSYI